MKTKPFWNRIRRINDHFDRLCEGGELVLRHAHRQPGPARGLKWLTQPFCVPLLSVICLFTYPNSTQAIQRMGLLSGGNTHIPAGGTGQLPTVCLDEHDEPPTTDDRYTSVFNASSPNAATVEIEGRSIPLQKAIDDGLVTVSGLTPSTALEAEIDAVRVNNLSGKPISVRVNQSAVLGTGGHRPFNYDVNKLLGADADQDAVWREQMRLASRPLPKNESAPSAGWLATDLVAREAIHRRSTKEMRLFHFSVKHGESELAFADGTSIPLSTAEMEMLRAGTPLPTAHELSTRFSQGHSESHVLYSDQQLENNAAYVRERNALAFGLQAAYPKANIYRDPLSTETPVRAQKLSEFSVTGASDLLIVIPGDSAPDTQIPYTRIITNLREDLAKANVETVRFKLGMVYDGKQGRAVFVITGHSSEQLARFVRQVGEARYFRDNYVILNSCGVGPAPALITEINGKYGAIGTFSFRGEIRAGAVHNYMLDLLEKLKGTETKKFVPLLIESVRSKGLFGMFTISKFFIGQQERLGKG